MRARSVHHVMKVVAGTPLRRPAWFFDIDEYGEGLADVGTHVVDLVQWTAFPDQAVDYRKDVEVLSGRRWPLRLTKEQFTRVTGESEFPAALAAHVNAGVLDYYCNNAVAYTLRGVHVALEISWNWEAADGGDVYEASFRGTKSRVEIRQGKAERFVPEVYIAGAAAGVSEAVERRVAALQGALAGTGGSEERGGHTHRGTGEVPRGARGAFRTGDQSLFRICDVAESDAGVGDSIHAGEISGVHQGRGEGEAMRTMLLIMVMAAALCAQETRHEIVNAAQNPADDAKGLSDKVPDVYAIATQFERVVVLRFKFDTDLLAGLQKMVKEQKIENAIVLSGMGSVRGYQVHQVSNRDVSFEEHVREESHGAGGYYRHERLRGEWRAAPAHHAGEAGWRVRRASGAGDPRVHVRGGDAGRAEGRGGLEPPRR